MSLDYGALYRLAHEQAQNRAYRMYPPHRERDRQIAVWRLTEKYYRQYTRP